MKTKTSVIQTSESFRLSAILSLSGGLQDAYTYNTRGNVFANAQTGNVVLMGQYLLSGRFGECFRYLFPLTAFIAGILLAEQIRCRFKDKSRFHWRQIVLAVEILLLALVGFMPAQYNLPANILVSLSCAMQVQSFRTVHGYGYASTMIIGNLRSGTESLSHYFMTGSRDSLMQFLHYYGIILIFALGAGIGGILSGTWDLKTIWVSAGLLMVCLVMMNREDC